MENFDWTTLNLMFPEWGIDAQTGKREEGYWKNFQEKPKYSHGSIQFLFGDYGMDIKLPTIPLWITQTDSLKEDYLKFSQKLYQDVLKNLDDSLNILEGWKKFVQKFDVAQKQWMGRLQDFLQFTRQSNGSVAMYDYYHVADVGNNSVSFANILSKVKSLPKNSLNEKWLKYRSLSDYVGDGSFSGSCGNIIGTTLKECIKNANEIYSHAQELGELKYLMR